MLILSIFNLSGCVGDIFTFLFIRKLDKNIEFSEFDDTTSFGLYSDKDLSKGKYLGVRYIGCCDKLERNDYKKIKVSKMSYIIIFVILGISFITLFM